MNQQDLRQTLIETARMFRETGLSVARSGNLSTRIAQGFLITPTGVPYEGLEPEHVVGMDLDGQVISGALKPSSEWPFHRAIYCARAEVHAIVHVHSPYATGIACTRQAIPAFHYMVAVAGGDSIRCADYATFGSEQLSVNALAALEGRRACLLANHGMIALGEDIPSAFRLAQEVEALAQQYWIGKQAGSLVLLDPDEMQVNLEKYRTYGKQT